MKRDTMIFSSVFMLVGGIFIFALAFQTRAQDEQASQCAALVEQTYEIIEASCTAGEGGTACFGSGASAEQSDEDAGAFEDAGDTIPLASLTRLSTQGLDADEQSWGAALMNVFANVPRALSETGLRYILLGDVTLENLVPADNAYVPVEPIEVTAIVGANLRATPSGEGRVIVSVPVGTSMQAHGLSADRGWVNILHEGRTAWISRQVITAQGGSLDDLPALTASTQATMQSFILRTGTPESACADVPPPFLIIQGPETHIAEITVNGVTIRFSSAIALRVLPDNTLQIITLAGSANTSNISVPGGFTLSIPLDSIGTRPGGPATGLRPINDVERTGLTAATRVISPELLYAALRVPTQSEINEVLASINRSTAGGGTTEGPASGQASCARFRPTSPLDGFAFGVTNFYWDGAPGATAYRLNIYDGGGAIVRSIDASAQSTTLSVDTGGGLGGGSNFTWDVQALVNGQVACTTGRVTVGRDAGSQPVGGGQNRPLATPTACTWGC